MLMSMYGLLLLTLRTYSLTDNFFWDSLSDGSFGVGVFDASGVFEF